jgi:hypothetical protein
MATTLNPATTSTKCALSGGNLTVEKTSGTGYGSSASAGSAGGATKVYVEAILNVDSGGSGTNAFGVASRTDGFEGNYVGLGNFSAGWFTDGGVYRNNLLVSTIATFGVGHRVGIAADTSARTIKFRNITTASAWSAAFDIAHDAAGVPYYFVFSAGAVGAKATFIADGTFVGTPPDGSYVEWDGDAISGGAASFTLTATPGALALTGTTTNLRRALFLTATTAALALTGSAANLARSLVLTATQGALALTGIVVNLAYSGVAASYTITATTGALSLVGNTANLVYARIYALVTEAGTLLLTGTPAELRHTTPNNVLTAEPGALILTGSPAELRHELAVPPAWFDGGANLTDPGRLVFGIPHVTVPNRW